MEINRLWISNINCVTELVNYSQIVKNKRQIMKEVLVLLALAVSTSSFATNKINLGDEIKNKAVFNLQEVDLNSEGKDFVTAKFRIDNDVISVLYIDGTQEILENKVKETLEEMHIQSDYETGKEYVMKFRFSEES